MKSILIDHLNKNRINCRPSHLILLSKGSSKVWTCWTCWTVIVIITTIVSRK
uniref:HNH endonuclease n=1 Tax=Psychroserpens luteolus TaxID=2855840 RepID=UPI00374D2840